MKIKVVKKDYDEVVSAKKPENVKPIPQSQFFRKLLYVLSKSELKATAFSLESNIKLDKNKPYLFLMNHSSFTDLQITAKILKDKPYHIVCTNDGFVGKNWLMRHLGCIPAKKFIPDLVLIKDMKYAMKKLNSSILMFPEASYSFDGTTTPLPESIGKFVKVLGAPVVMIRTKGAFLRDPLYNNLQKRDAKITAKMDQILSEEDIKSMSVEDINNVITKAFEYDHFKEQFESGVKISEQFRADGLERVLYKCPRCQSEGHTIGKGVRLTCSTCKAEYELLESGKLKAATGETEFEFVSDWYKWERECVKNELLSHTYKLDVDVSILIFSDYSAVYDVGDGHLVHDENGFVLTGCDGRLNYKQSPKYSYSLYSDYYWYEIGDMISIGDTNYQYYCFPQNKEGTIVAKARLAAEESYKVSMAN